MMDLSFKTPCNILIVGASCSGKTFFTRRLLQHAEEMFDEPFHRIIYSYGEFQPLFIEMKQERENRQFVEGFPEDIYSLFENKKGLLVLDDQMSALANEPGMADLITKGCHHRDITTIFIVQNLFPPGKHARTISLNSHYIVVFKNPRDSLRINTLARQAFQNATYYVMESFKDADEKPYSYFLIDLHALTSPTSPPSLNLNSPFLTTQLK